MDFLLALNFLAPLIGFVAGFLVGTFRSAPLRSLAAIIVVASPLALLSMPLLLPSALSGERYAAAFFLTVFGAHIVLWMIFAALGVVVGIARGRRAG